MLTSTRLLPQQLLALALLVFLCQLPLFPVAAQDTVTGAFEGTVTNADTGEVIAGASALIINQQTGQTYARSSDTLGRFYQGLLPPGVYTIRVAAPGFVTKEVQQRLFITRAGEVVPVPVSLDPAPPAPVSTPTPSTTGSSPAAGAALTAEDTDVRARINAGDASHGGAFTEEEVSTLPLGGRTVVRSFDELTLLLPGVAPPPQTLGSVAGPGVGAGVGTAGQFAVNGLRSRANNFTVDGSDNNDEDIGVRRQGFVALNSQPIESVKEYQAITLLAPAQFGRNIGAQVNAVSKSGGSATHGALYGFFNSSQLNARNQFDTNFGNGTAALRGGNNQSVLLDGTPITVRNGSGGEDSFTFGHAGFVLGGPLEDARGPDKPARMFYFVAAEGYINNATQEASFAVPTVAQRGFNDTGATGIFQNPTPVQGTTFAFPTTSRGDAIFSLFPFPNNPQGVYGANTVTQTLPASAQGKVASGKFDANFRIRGRQQSLTNRYNFTDDYRIIPVTGGALFSSLEPRVRTQNNSFFFNSELSGADTTRPTFNQLRLSYGRTRLNFSEVRDPFLRPSSLPNTPFLLNAPLVLNSVLPNIDGAGRTSPNTGPVRYTTDPAAPTSEAGTGPIGQLQIAGFSPVGVDVFNFPQRRVNNTYQVADELTMRAGRHTYVFGVDARRTELNSQLPRNSRPRVTFSGAPQLAGNYDFQTGRFDSLAFTGRFIPAVSFAAAEAASGFTQTLAVGGESGINLRYYQLDFYGQDQWRLKPTLSLSYGLRYEYNTPPRETHNRIERAFNDPALALLPGVRNFIGSRTRIFEPDRNNFAPRVSLAYAPNIFGRDRLTVVRAGYGLFYDQILGAVVSQSRNVYPNYLTIDLAGGGLPNLTFVPGVPGRVPGNGPCRPGRDPVGGILFTNCFPYQLTNPQLSLLGGTPVVQPGTLNTLNPALSFAQLVSLFNQFGTGGRTFPPESSFGFTIPAQQLETPLAHHYSVTLDQQLGRDLVLSASYVGTRGRHLLRFSTPNLGQEAFIVPLIFAANVFSEFGASPAFLGLTLPPGARIAPQRDGFVGGRPVAGVGVVNRFETSAGSSYNSLQLQLRSRFRRSLQLQASYTFGRATDDVSDVFDLAGASALPQDSFNLAGERGPANFDVRHRLAYHFIYDLPAFGRRGELLHSLLGGWQLASLGSFQTGQPFTVNSIFDVNLDGNLTDRLNSTSGITRTGDRRQPLRLTGDPLSMIAPIGQDGKVGRNTFRAGNVLDLNASLLKSISFGERKSLSFRMDAFNFINRANYGIPVRLLEAPGFGQATNTVTTARRIQFALKLSF
jgi:hypothetical protein